MAQAYANCATSVGSLGSPITWTYLRSLRRVQEVAFRYRMTGNTTYGNDAKAALLAAVASTAPTSASAYQSATVASAVAITYDLVYPLLSSSERSTVVNHLLGWVSVMQSGTAGPGPYSAYLGATDNFSFAWSTAIAMCLMAVWGDTTYPNIVSVMQSNLVRLQDGWSDAVSPDGSIDEGLGYANYGQIYAMWAAVAALNCGLGDYLRGTNAPFMAKWVGASLFGGSFFYIADASLSHKGLNMDPMLYYCLKRNPDPEALWALDRLYSVAPIGDNSASHAFSPHLAKALFYPESLTPQPPSVLSAFFRDNLNQGNANDNKLRNYPEVGLGGVAYLHNAADPAWARFGAVFNIRDEWMNHAHEDDGNFLLSSEGVPFYLDLGYAGTAGYAAAQSIAHNIVLVQGVAGFNGDSNNYYAPPNPSARFLGRKVAASFSPTFDYVRGDHANMWMMQEATRSVVMVKDPLRPYAILVDRVRKDGTSRTYEEIFHSAGGATGAGTASNPLTVVAGGSTLRATWLSPAAVTVVPGSYTVQSTSAVGYYRNLVRATGTEVAFVSVHSKDGVAATAPLLNPRSTTVGGTITLPSGTDKILVRRAPGLIGDSTTVADAEFAWIRTSGGALAEWALGEGATLLHGGVPLLATSEPVVAAARRGRIDVSVVNPVFGATLSATFYTPFPVTTVVVDGVPTPFTQNGAFLFIGPAPPIPAPSGDRAYTFGEGFLWDADPSGPAVVTADGRFTSSGGWASLAIRNGLALTPRPMSFGFDFSFVPGASGSSVGLRIESSPGAQDLLSIDLLPSTTPGHFTAVIFRPGAPTIGIHILPMGLNGLVGHLNAVYRPQQGQLVLQRPDGSIVATHAVPVQAAGVHARVLCRETAVVDNVTWFDSEEDGVTPQGIAFFGYPSGRAGFALRSTSLAATGNYGLYAQGAWLDPNFVAAWAAMSGLVEVSATLQLVQTAPLAPSVPELVFETTLPGLLTSRGSTSGLRFSTPAGIEIVSLWTY